MIYARIIRLLERRPRSQEEADPIATKKKIVTDVMKKGDACFRSGDLLEIDDLGFVYFLDRGGDTFRWKAENVSTLEVEARFTPIVGFRDVAVYGVEIPDTDDRAGMDAIGVEPETLDFKDLYAKVLEKLSFYAHPVFIRVGSDLEVTSTMKLKKKHLQRQSYNPTCFDDDVFVVDHENKTYKAKAKEGTVTEMVGRSDNWKELMSHHGPADSASPAAGIRAPVATVTPVATRTSESLMRTKMEEENALNGSDAFPMKHNGIQKATGSDQGSEGNQGPAPKQKGLLIIPVTAPSISSAGSIISTVYPNAEHEAATSGTALWWSGIPTWGHVCTVHH